MSFGIPRPFDVSANKMFRHPPFDLPALLMREGVDIEVMSLRILFQGTYLSAAYVDQHNKYPYIDN